MVAQIDGWFGRARPGRAAGRLIGYSLFEGRPITTRGRWFNPLSRALLATISRLPIEPPVIAPIFIVGNGRSGTTILGRLLSIHRDVGFLNEPKAIWHSVCPFEDVIGNYSEQPARYRLAEGDVSAVGIARARRLFGAYLRIVRANRLVDKYPELMFRVPFVKRIFPDAKFLYVVRDGRHTIASIAAWQRRFATTVRGRTQGWWGVDDRKWNIMVDELVRPDAAFEGLGDVVSGLSSDLDKAAVEWIVGIREGTRLMEQYQDDVHLVRHEDLVANPRACLDQVLRFTGLVPDEAVIEYARTVVRTPAAHPDPAVDARLEPLFLAALADMDYMA